MEGFKSKKSAFFNLKDTLFLKTKDLPQSPDNDSENSSSYKELNTTEQAALARSFRAIQTSQSGANGPAGDNEEDNMDSAYSWKPSSDLQERITGISSPAKSKAWDSDIETSTVEGDSIHLIPTSTRESTPDSVGFSNQLTMKDENRDRQERRQVNAAHVQIRVDNARDSPIQGTSSPAQPQPVTTDMGKSTRAMIGQMNTNEKNSQEPAHIPAKPDTFDIVEDSDKDVFPCLPKCFLFILGIMILLGGVVAAVVIFKENKPSAQHGDIIPNVIINDECNDAVLPLGDPLEIQCVFDVTHEYRKQIPLTREIIVDSPNQLPQTLFSTANATGGDAWIIIGPNITCTSEGTYTLTFVDMNGKQLHRATVTLTVKAQTVMGSMTQRKVDDYGVTAFDVSCSIVGDCHNYDVDFVGRRLSYSQMDTLNEKKQCSNSYSDTTGHTISCTTEWEDSVVDNYRTYLGCRLRDGPVVRSKQFSLPDCLLTQQCNFNCSTKSAERQALDSGICTHNRLSRCFPAERPVWQYKVCPEDRALDCGEYVEQYECQLGWCRSRTGVYYKGEVAGELLCGDFEVLQPKTTTTTTTTTTTSTSTSTSTTTAPTTPPPLK